jgi:GNAT superfamily N-acetyltransferase
MDNLTYQKSVRFDRCKMIRPAVPSDSLKAVPLILQAIGHLALVLTGSVDDDEAAAILTDFFERDNNRISYQNALILEEEGEPVGMAIVYDGAKARELDLPLERAAAKKLGDAAYHIPSEPEPSEFYLDVLSVSPLWQGKGYGRQLIEAACDRARELGHSRLALLVEIDNPSARRLYERLEFRIDYRKWLADQEYFHMTRRL